MTTIVATREVMAADKKYTGEFRVRHPKIQRIGDSLFATAGSVTQGESFLAWVRAGKDMDSTPKELGDFEALELNATGIWLWDEVLFPIKCSGKFATAGSGGSYALIALRCGKSPREAVSIAAEFDNDTGNGVQVVKL